MEMIETVSPSEDWMGHVPGRGGASADPMHVELWEAALENVGSYCIFDVPKHEFTSNAVWIKRPRSFFEQRAKTRGMKASVRIDPRNPDRFGVCLWPKEDGNE